jgi:hypothetical protein
MPLSLNPFAAVMFPCSLNSRTCRLSVSLPLMKYENSHRGSVWPIDAVKSCPLSEMTSLWELFSAQEDQIRVGIWELIG